jgi:hypothetical protein
MGYRENKKQAKLKSRSQALQKLLKVKNLIPFYNLLIKGLNMNNYKQFNVSFNQSALDVLRIDPNAEKVLSKLIQSNNNKYFIRKYSHVYNKEFFWLEEGKLLKDTNLFCNPDKDIKLETKKIKLTKILKYLTSLKLIDSIVLKIEKNYTGKDFTQVGTYKMFYINTEVTDIIVKKELTDSDIAFLNKLYSEKTVRHTPSLCYHHAEEQQVT